MSITVMDFFLLLPVSLKTSFLNATYIHHFMLIILMHLWKFTENIDKTQNSAVFYGIYLNITLRFLNTSSQDFNCLNQRLYKHHRNQMIRRLLIYFNVLVQKWCMWRIHRRWSSYSTLTFLMQIPEKETILKQTNSKSSSVE